ncbi:hypothetical protein [Desulfurella sp.]|uniref:hypothetical protein n=1 Tax=Desulfurella sp. TaxID=1962857 RepID=UPI0025B9CE6A|nr:hypothetical protein [Desulfurella sp.]
MSIESPKLKLPPSQNWYFLRYTLSLGMFSLILRGISKNPSAKKGYKIKVLFSKYKKEVKNNGSTC